MLPSLKRKTRGKLGSQKTVTLLALSMGPSGCKCSSRCTRLQGSRSMSTRVSMDREALFWGEAWSGVSTVRPTGGYAGA